MAGKKENLKSLFSNTRSRVIIIFTAALLILAVVIGYVKLSSINTGPGASAELNSAPGNIQSIPGALDPTAQYAKLQEEQNITQAQQAERTGGSAIPTIIRTQTLGQGVGVIGAQTGVGFAALTRENEEGNQNSLWIQSLQNSGCSKASMNQVINAGGQLKDLRAACSCVQLKDNGYSLQDLNQVCGCKDLRAAGYNARQLKDAGYTAEQLKNCDFNACELRNAGSTAQAMKDAGFSDDELKGAGFSDADIKKASGLPDGITAADILKSGCGVEALTKLRQQGVSAAAIRRISGCSVEQLKAAGYNANELKDAGFTDADLRKAGFTPAQSKAAGYTAKDLLDAGLTPADLTNAGYTAAQIKAAQALPDIVEIPKGDCTVVSLQQARANGITPTAITKTLGCSASPLKNAGNTAKELRDAGFTVAEAKNAGFTPKELKDAGYNPKELKDAGVSAKDLKDAGFTVAQLKGAGFGAKALKDAGLNAAQLKAVGFDAHDLKEAGFDGSQLKAAGFGAKDLKDAGYSAVDLKNAGFIPEESQVAGLANPNIQPTVSAVTGVPSASGIAQQATGSNQQLQAILGRQNQQMAEQKYQQKIQQKSSDMLSAANQVLAEWKTVSTQTYMAGTPDEKAIANAAAGIGTGAAEGSPGFQGNVAPQVSVIKTGDILFAVMDTAVNSDQPGPILATIVSGKLKGAKLIGSFNLPSNSNQMVITFNTMSIPAALNTIPIAAYAIDPNTARTALSSKTNHHYLLRYGSLFASSFMEGIGNAFQSANTTVTIGGTGAGNDVTVSNGVGRSTLENAVIGLATVGKTWGQQAQQLFNKPTTVEVYSGTPLGILFTQDVKIN